MYSAMIMLDSVNPVGDRLTTFEVTYPRFVHSELMTHRLFSRNSASSRAIPNSRLRRRVEADPVLPVTWGKNQKGMQADEELGLDVQTQAERVWLQARDEMLRYSQSLADLGVHKQLCNRLLEPWMFITVIISATEFENFFALRCDPDAQPEIRRIAEMMKTEYDQGWPQVLQAGEWHLPYVLDDEQGVNIECKRELSTARCARVSYLTHDGRRDPKADFGLHDRLSESGHWSCFEHQAQALDRSERVGNFVGWRQYRKLFPNEHRGRSIEFTS